MSMIKNRKIAVAGRLKIHPNRKALAAVIRSAGGEVVEDVTPRIDYLICNHPEDSTVKTNAARRFQIPVLTEEEFLNKFVPGAMSSDEHISNSAKNQGTDVVGRIVKFKCRMCGMVFDSEEPPSICAACGMDDFEAIPFDGECPKCGLKFYALEVDNSCPRCGKILNEKPKNRTVGRRSQTRSQASESSRSTASSRARGTSSLSTGTTGSGSGPSVGDVIASIVAWIIILGAIGLFVWFLVWAWPVIEALFGFLWILVKCVWWVICLPFRFLGWLFGCALPLI